MILIDFTLLVLCIISILIIGRVEANTYPPPQPRGWMDWMQFLLLALAAMLVVSLLQRFN